MFIDELDIEVRAGEGGRGCVAFRREKYVPKGGPAGGDGGCGGHVIAIADTSMNTLMKVGRRRVYQAEKGQPGEGSNRHGRNGKDVCIHLPAGTEIWDETGEILIKDLVDPDIPVILVSGGKGGKGNAAFRSSTNQTPQEATLGAPGEGRKLRLRLKLIADVGLVGMPNAGKSTLLGKISAARPKVASYPFTTKSPNLGVVSLDEATVLTVADIPGLIKGANIGAGMGDAFLRHIERTSVLLFLVDASSTADIPPEEALKVLFSEIESFSEVLAAKPFMVAANKMDLQGAQDGLVSLKAATKDKTVDDEVVGVVPVSALTGDGLRGLLHGLWEMVRANDLQ